MIAELRFTRCSRYLIAITLILSFLVGCNSPQTEDAAKKRQVTQKRLEKEEEEAWSKAELGNTLSGYKNFLSKYPSGLHRDKALANIQNLKKMLRDQLPISLQWPRGVQITIEGSYSTSSKDLLGRSVEEAFSPSIDDIHSIQSVLESQATQLLSSVGLKVLTDKSEPHDGTLRIVVELTAIGVQYKEVGGYEIGLCYTGASVSGNTSLQMRQMRASVNPMPLYEPHFHGSLKPPSRFETGCCRIPSCAPFDSAYKVSGFREGFMLLMAKTFGPTFLINALKDDDLGAIPAVGTLKYTPAFEELIRLVVEDPNAVGPSSEIIANALKNIDEPRAVERLVAELKSTPRTNTAVALGFITIAPLLTALSDESLEVRKTAGYALGEIRDIRAVEQLITVFESEADEDFRAIVVRTLGKIDDKRAGEVLETAKNDKSKAVREAASDALKQRMERKEQNKSKLKIMESS